MDLQISRDFHTIGYGILDLKDLTILSGIQVSLAPKKQDNVFFPLGTSSAHEGSRADFAINLYLSNSLKK
jgi:hypothetical protein